MRAVNDAVAEAAKLARHKHAHALVLLLVLKSLKSGILWVRCCFSITWVSTIDPWNRSFLCGRFWLEMMFANLSHGPDLGLRLTLVFVLT